MKMEEARLIIEHGITPKGYRVSFERKIGNGLHGDYFPAGDEQPIPTAEAAWTLAKQFAKQTVGKCINIHIVDNELYRVEGYDTIENRE